MSSQDGSLVVIGAGPAGLTAAHELTRAGKTCTIIERENQPGGLARTIWRNGYGYDIGGHRFYTKSERVQNTWHELLGDDFLQVKRLSRIFYDGKFFQYPLRPGNALSGLGVTTSAAVIASYIRRKVQPLPLDGSFERYIINRFGDRLYRTFFKDYTEKVWGVPCSEIRADWASQRIRDLSLGVAIKSAVFGEATDGARSLVQQFHYPRLGPGMLWERMADAVSAAGCRIHYDHKVIKIRHNGHDRIESITAAPRSAGTGELTLQAPDHVFTTMALQPLLRQMDPLPPDEVLSAAGSLRYRDFISVNLVLHGQNPFADQWIYVHDPAVRVGRIQNFRNWSPDLVPPGDTTGIGMEYFCTEDDDLWNMSDESLCDLATGELRRLGLAGQCEIGDAFVVRVKKAYPFYDAHFDRHLGVIRQWLSRFRNLTTIGRNGLHRYNNQDHSMLMGMQAVANYLHGAEHDVWDVNSDSTYLETAAPKVK